MKIEDVQILNWQPWGNPPGTKWWADREANPDEPEAVHAILKLKMSLREYMELLDKNRKGE